MTNSMTGREGGQDSYYDTPPPPTTTTTNPDCGFAMVHGTRRGSGFMIPAVSSSWSSRPTPPMVMAGQQPQRPAITGADDPEEATSFTGQQQHQPQTPDDDWGFGRPLHRFLWDGTATTTTTRRRHRHRPIRIVALPLYKEPPL
jgi:hypothetical protein